MKGNFKSQLLHVMANTILNHKIQSLQVYGWALSYTRRKKEMKNLHPTTATSPLLLLLLLLSHFSRVQLCVTPEMAAHQAPPSLGFSRQEHWSGLPFPSPYRYGVHIFLLNRYWIKMLPYFKDALKINPTSFVILSFYKIMKIFSSLGWMHDSQRTH